MKDKKNMVWVGVLNEIPETKKKVYYVPFECDKQYVYTGKDALPYFLTQEECKIWCDNNPYKSK